ncbi:MAG: NTP transferase domain-containing protein [Nitrospira sp.]|nr:NTP transferase domain-containing protein [Nitrospira sp.]MDE0404676.1 NTP transferase domain-containing protein [Nitrospira sp.]MDE0486931.1 NTP transferase domain-containing protein [Nitrospira sp.]
MKAVILAAGRGRRLDVVTMHRPKCLIDVGGKPLLYRYFDALAHLGVTRICMVVGYKQEHVREAVASYPATADVTFLVNPDFERGSIVSLWTAREAMDDDVVIMDADVLFHPAVLDRLLNSSHANALLMDETVTQHTEECMVVTRKGRVTALSKQVPDEYDLVGEGVGFLRVSQVAVPQLLRSVETRVRQGLLDVEYEDALADFFREVPVGVEKIGGLPWIEIDFPEDLERAKQEILPRLALEQALFRSLQSVDGTLDGVVDRYVNRKISRPLSRLFMQLGCSPNAVTLLSMIIGLGGAACFATGSYAGGIAGALLFQLAVILDCCDGEVARLTFAESPLGQALDLVSDNIVHVAVFAGIAWGAYQENLVFSGYLPLFLGGIAVLSTGASLWCVDRVKSLKGNTMRWQRMRQAARTRFDFILRHVANRDFSIVVLICACLGVLPWFLWLVAAGTSVFAIMMAWNLYRAFPIHRS